MGKLACTRGLEVGSKCELELERSKFALALGNSSVLVLVHSKELVLELVQSRFALALVHSKGLVQEQEHSKSALAVGKLVGKREPEVGKPADKCELACNELYEAHKLELVHSMGSEHNVSCNQKCRLQPSWTQTSSRRQSAHKESDSSGGSPLVES